MVSSEGKLEYCPFRTYVSEEPYVIEGENTVKSEWFMPCLHEQCICYDKWVGATRIKETCYRDQVVYQRVSVKEEVK